MGSTISSFLQYTSEYITDQTTADFVLPKDRFDELNERASSLLNTQQTSKDNNDDQQQ